jgi:Uma2 family endonuclease
MLLMSEAAKKRATYQDLEAAPPHHIAEILNGELVVQPRPAIPHSRVASMLAVDLGGPFDLGRGGPGGWVLLYEPELHLGEDVLVPDYAGWRRKRVPVLPNTPAMDLAPDWVCEILSPATAARDRTDKLPIFAREKIEHVWFVDPRARTLEVLGLDGTTFRVLTAWRDTAIVRAAPFDAVELELIHWWELGP